MKKIEIRTIDETPLIENLEIDLEYSIKDLKKIIKEEQMKRGEKEHEYMIFYKNCPKNDAGFSECGDKLKLKEILNPNEKVKDKVYYVWRLRAASPKRSSIRRYSLRRGGKGKKQRKTKKAKRV